MAGVPFDVIESFATPETASAARTLLVRRAQFKKAKQEVESVLWTRSHGLSEELFRAWRRTVRLGTSPRLTDVPSAGAFANYEKSVIELDAAELHLDGSLAQEIEHSRAALIQKAGDYLPAYLVFAGDSIRQSLVKHLIPDPKNVVSSRNRNARALERHLLLYLQRICAKNDTFSQFGPSAWGSIVADANVLSLTIGSNRLESETYLERWTAHAAAAALNADPNVRSEISPRLHPSGRIQGNQFVFTETGETIALTSAQIAIVNRCDGATPAYVLGTDLPTLVLLSNRNILKWEVEVPALEPHAFDTLVADVAKWRASELRDLWLERLRSIVTLCVEFAQTKDPNTRVTLLEEAKGRVNDLQVIQPSSRRFLYAATNAISEDCFRNCTFHLDETLTNSFVRDAEPWIDLWRDSYAFVASRVGEGLRGLLQTAPVKNNAVPLPAFLRHCEMQKMPLTGSGLVTLAHIAFLELKSAFQTSLSGGADAAEWTLTTQECHFVRNNYDFPKFDEYTFPSADLQISAMSVDHVRRGEHEWVLAELHPPIAMLQHGVYWSCPDKAAFARDLANTILGQPNFFYGFVPADFTAHTAVRQFDVIPDLSYFVGQNRGNKSWRSIPAAETEVFIHEKSSDVALRKRGSHEYLGSFARNWIIPLGFHPFSFSLGYHTPRLRCGKVIVQRRSWTVTRDELGHGNFTGISRDLVLAVERLRAARDLPRYVYIRPTEQALRRSGAEGRDKDTKPVFIDLESYLFLEIFQRWLTKADEIEVTEMLPDPDHLLWKEPDGRRTFELRTLIVPRE